MSAQWDIPLHVDTSLAAFVRGVLPATTQTTDSSSGGSNNRSDGGSQTSAEKRHHSGDGRHLSSTSAVSVIVPLLNYIYYRMSVLLRCPLMPKPTRVNEFALKIVFGIFHSMNCYNLSMGNSPPPKKNEGMCV